MEWLEFTPFLGDIKNILHIIYLTAMFVVL